MNDINEALNLLRRPLIVVVLADGLVVVVVQLTPPQEPEVLLQHDVLQQPVALPQHIFPWQQPFAVPQPNKEHFPEVPVVVGLVIVVVILQSESMLQEFTPQLLYELQFFKIVLHFK